MSFLADFNGQAWSQAGVPDYVTLRAFYQPLDGVRLDVVYATGWRALTINAVTGSGDELTVDVVLRTEQDAADGRDGQTCSDWTIAYTMSWDGTIWRIAGADDPDGLRAC
ncbi:hypothetical protein [Paenarthrobacter nicotinovorans]|uniref:hypothetical protein n=1 Tax=Paenarthrobacter nicotinovorans TaxID=29320 RepID=UPI000479B4FA|nr:hypothetical protein [Paenarthrobacter nicotinovorans]